MKYSSRKIAGIASGAACVLVGVLIFAGWGHPRRAWDRIQGFAIEVTDYFMPRVATVPESFVEERRYQNTYAGLPRQFIRSGHFLFYRADEDTSVREISRAAIRYTHYLRTYALEKAIREYNGIKESDVKRKGLILIPHSLPPFLPDMKNKQMPALITARGLYYTGGSIGNERVLKSVDEYAKYGLNTIVFDAKDVTGIVNYYSNNPDVQEYNAHEKRTIDNIDNLIRYFKRRGVYVIARIAVFHDHLLFKKNPDWAIHSKSTGRPWSPNTRELWLDPTNRHVQDYSIGMAVELAEKGVDEIQFDYIRFPTTGNLADAAFANHFGAMPKEQTIVQFLKRAHDEISVRNCRLSIDIFGVVAWGKTVDIQQTGQRIDLLSKHCDVISPMLYPSHFSDNFNGFANPGDHPYHFIYEGCKKVIGLSGDRVIRPWLQAFRWRVSSYDERYIIKQIQASDDSGAKGYLFWNASNNYETVLRALAMIRNGGGKSRKDELAKDARPRKAAID